MENDDIVDIILSFFCAGDVFFFGSGWKLVCEGVYDIILKNCNKKQDF